MRGYYDPQTGVSNPSFAGCARFGTPANVVGGTFSVKPRRWEQNSPPRPAASRWRGHRRRARHPRDNERGGIALMSDARGVMTTETHAHTDAGAVLLRELVAHLRQ